MGSQALISGDEGQEVPQVARVDPAHRQQHVQVGDTEVRVVGRFAAHPGAQAQVAAQQGGQFDAGGGRRARYPRQQRPHAVLLRRQVLGVHPVPGGGGEGAAVGERDGAAAGEPLVAPVDHVAGDSRPDEADDRAVAVVGVHAGAADLDELGPDRGEGAQVELALGVQASGDRRALRRQQPVGADDLAGRLLTDEQVVAVRVERVDVQPGLRAGQQGAQLPGEDVVPQPLRGTHVLLVPGEGDGVAGGGRGLRGAVDGQYAGHGSLLVTGRGRRAVPPSLLCPCRLTFA
ncbi:putative protein TPRXL [Streptomyces afghaniensis 772]|uniref:Uncharacterized protein n=1 Tax=Streptomyces afghaniensis 772 TaxID=1283301 RepID=S4MZK5_9ACTN|nr:putative protein TPRXL [Streptomyces afghaniensis 772]